MSARNPPPTSKRTIYKNNNKKPSHFQTKKPFPDKCHFPVLSDLRLFFFSFFTQHSQCGQLTGNFFLLLLMVYCEGGAAATINSLLCFSKSLQFWKGKKRSYCKMTCHLASRGTLRTKAPRGGGVSLPSSSSPLRRPLATHPVAPRARLPAAPRLARPPPAPSPRARG